MAPAPSPSLAASRLPGQRERLPQERHIQRDHTYVLGELRRMALIVAFIIAGLVITAILR